VPHLWVTPEDLGDNSSSPFAYEACQTATYILWALSGRKYNGVQTVTERYTCPCRKIYGASTSTTMADIVHGDVINRLYTSGSCGCANDHSRVRLRGRPVQSVSEVISMGDVLTEADYRIVNKNVLEGISSVSFDPCDVQVTYTFGARPPAAGSRAARYLADQLVKSWSGDECELPDRVTSVSRQGVSYTILDNQDFLAEMRTGVYAVDLFIKATNPDNARKPSRVFSPDLPRARQTTAAYVGMATPELGPDDLTITPGMGATWVVELNTAQADMLDGVTWQPLIQVSSWNGAVLYEVGAGRVDIVDGVMTVSLTTGDTGSSTISGPGQWDLYAQNVSDTSTVIHLRTGNVYFQQ
jgi:hypothetical protein